MCVTVGLFVLQRQQYPYLPEEQIKTKAHIWKICDEKDQERRRAFYRDVLTQQQLVSQFLNVRLWMYTCIQIVILMFQSRLSSAHTAHTGHTEQSEKPSDADAPDHCEPAWTDLNLIDVVREWSVAFVIHQLTGTFFITAAAVNWKYVLIIKLEESTPSSGWIKTTERHHVIRCSISNFTLWY